MYLNSTKKMTNFTSIALTLVNEEHTSELSTEEMDEKTIMTSQTSFTDSQYFSSSLTNSIINSTISTLTLIPFNCNITKNLEIKISTVNNNKILYCFSIKGK